MAGPPPTEVPYSAHAESYDGPPSNLPSALTHSPVTGISPSASPGRYAPIPSYSCCTPPLNVSPRIGTVGIPCPPSLPPFPAVRPCKTGLSVCTRLPATWLAVKTLVDQHPHRRAGIFFNALPNPSGRASYPAIFVAQCWMTASAAILNTVGDSGLPCVTPLDPVNGAPYIENTPNPLISLGNYPEGFSDEDMVGCIWMNKDDLERLV